MADKVLLVEDEDLLRSSLTAFLRRSGLEVAEAEDEDGAMARLKEESFNLVVTDLFLSDGTGLGIMKYLQECCPETQCIVITGHASLDTAINALRKGACDYLLKPFEYEDLKAAVEKALKKHSEQRQIKKLDFQKIAKQYGLTKKELEITRVVVLDGLSNEGISEALGISKNTVKVHLRNIFKKLGVESKNAMTTSLHSGNTKGS